MSKKTKKEDVKEAVAPFTRVESPQPAVPPVVSSNEQNEAKNEDFEFDTLEELIDFEISTHEEGEELLDMSHTAYDLMSDELRDELAAKALEVVKVVNPAFYNEIKKGRVFVTDRDMYGIWFAVCLSPDKKESDAHDHKIVCSIPTSALILEGKDWKKFLEIAPFLDSNGILNILA